MVQGTLPRNMSSGKADARHDASDVPPLDDDRENSSQDPSIEALQAQEPSADEQLLPGPNRAPSPAASPSPPPPRRALTFLDGLAIVVGTQIGSGIFTTPAAVLAHVRSAPAALLVWLAAGGLAWTGAAAFVELGRRVPRNGGMVEYVRHGFGDASACVATWALLFVVKPASVAMVALIFADYALGGLGAGVPEGGWAVKGLAALALLVFTLLNAAGTRLSARIADFFFFLKLFGLGSVVVTGLTVGVARYGALRRADGPHEPDDAGTHADDSPSWTSAGVYTDAALAALWAYSGWETVRVPPFLP